MLELLSKHQEIDHSDVINIKVYAKNDILRLVNEGEKLLM